MCQTGATCQRNVLVNELLAEVKVAVSPSVGFSEYGANHVRFALIKNIERTSQKNGLLKCGLY